MKTFVWSKSQEILAQITITYLGRKNKKDLGDPFGQTAEKIIMVNTVLNQFFRSQHNYKYIRKESIKRSHQYKTVGSCYIKG